MHKGLTQATLGVLGAALLSGSVFAAGPTVGGLPNVIITDKMKQTDLLTYGGILTSGTQYDYLTGSTENRYRFTSAFDLASYITSGDDSSDLHYLFTELSAPATPKTTGFTITVNGDSGFAGTPAYSDVVGGPSVAAEGVLDLVNTDRSGGDASVPGPSQPADFQDEVVLELYVASSAVGTEQTIDSDTFTVFTTNDVTVSDGDTLSAPTSIYTPKGCTDDFAGWLKTTLTQIQDLTAVPTGTTALPFDFYQAGTAPGMTPATTTTAAGFGNVEAIVGAADTVSISTDATPAGTNQPAGYAPQFGSWGSWRRDADGGSDPIDIDTTVAVTKDNLYLVRWSASGATGTAVQMPQVRFRAGEPTNFGIGQTSDELIQNGANAIVNGAAVQNSWFYAHDDGTMGMMVDVFDFYAASIGTTIYPQGHSDYALTVDKVEVFETTVDQLQNPAVVVNEGVATMSLASGEADAPAGATAFDAAVWADSVISLSAPSSPRFSTAIDGNGYLTITTTASASNGIAGWDTLNYLLNSSGTAGVPDLTDEEIVTGVTNDQVVILQVWMSSPEGAVANNNLPTVRFGFQTDAWGETGSAGSPIVSQGRTMFHTFEAWNQSGLDVGDTVGSAEMALASGAKAYTAVFSPNVRAGSTIDLRPVVQAYSYPIFSDAVGDSNTNPAPRMAGTVEIQRVVLTVADFQDPSPVSECP